MNRKNQMITFVLCGLLPMQMVIASPKIKKIKKGSVQTIQDGQSVIYKTSKKTIINFSQFDIASKESVRFDQPQKSSAVLARVVGDKMSEIHGRLSSNGIVYLLNPSGIFIGKNAVVSVSQFYAAAAKMRDQDFLQGVNRFIHGSGCVRHEGTIIADSVHLFGRHVECAGKILAPEKMVSFSAGDEVYFGEKDGHMFIKVSQKALRKQSKEEISARDIYSIHIEEGAKVKSRDIKVQGGKRGLTRVLGNLDASQEVGNGGTIGVFGKDVYFARANLDVSGPQGGGKIHVGGERIQKGCKRPIAQNVTIDQSCNFNADATVSGKGGEIILAAKRRLEYLGNYSVKGGPEGGDGGFFQKAAKTYSCDLSQFKLDCSAPKGKMGMHVAAVLAETVSILSQSDFDDNFASTTLIQAQGANPSIIFGTGTGDGGGLVDAFFTAAAGPVVVEAIDGGGDPAGLININGAALKTIGGASLEVSATQINFLGTDTTGTVLAGTGTTNVDATIMTLAGKGTLDLSGGVTYAANIPLNELDLSGAALTGPSGDLTIGGAGVINPVSILSLTGASSITSDDALSITVPTVTIGVNDASFIKSTSNDTIDLTATGSIIFGSADAIRTTAAVTVDSPTVTVQGSTAKLPFGSNFTYVGVDTLKFVQGAELITTISTSIGPGADIPVSSQLTVQDSGSKINITGSGTLAITTPTLSLIDGGSLSSGGKLTIDSDTFNVQGTDQIVISGAGVDIKQQIQQGGATVRQTPLLIKGNGGDVTIGEDNNQLDFTIGPNGTFFKSLTIDGANNFEITGGIQTGIFTLQNGTGDATFNTKFIETGTDPNTGDPVFSPNAGLVTSGNIQAEFPLLNQDLIIFGGEVIVSTKGDVTFESPFYVINSSGGSAVASGQSSQPGGDVSITSDNGNVSVMTIGTIEGFSIDTPSSQTIQAGDINISAPNGDVNLFGKLFTAALPVQQASGSGDFGEKGQIVIDAQRLKISKATTTVTDQTFPNNLTFDTGSVQQARLVGNSISIPNVTLDAASNSLIPIYSTVFESIGDSTIKAYGSGSIPAGNIRVNYVKKFEAQDKLVVSSLTQFQGIGPTDLQRKVTSFGKVFINNSGIVKVSGIDTSSAPALKNVTSGADIFIQPGAGHSSTSFGNFPNGTISLSGDLTAGSGDISLASLPRGDNVSIATIFNKTEGLDITLSGDNLKTGQNEVMTFFGRMNLNFTTSCITGDLVAIKDVNISSPSITLDTHTTYNILTSTGGFFVNPKGAHIVSGGSINTTMVPMLSSGGRLIQEEKVLISPTVLKFQGIPLNFLGHGTPPPPPVPPTPPPPSNDHGTTHIALSWSGLIYYAPQAYLDVERLDLQGDGFEISREIKELCTNQGDESSCPAKESWDKLKEAIIQNRKEFNQFVENYLNTHVGFFNADEFIDALKRTKQGPSLTGYIQEIAHFESSLKANYPANAFLINENVDSLTKPEGLSLSEWQQVIKAF